MVLRVSIMLRRIRLRDDDIAWKYLVMESVDLTHTCSIRSLRICWNGDSGVHLGDDLH